MHTLTLKFANKFFFYKNKISTCLTCFNCPLLLFLIGCQVSLNRIWRLSKLKTQIHQKHQLCSKPNSVIKPLGHIEQIHQKRVSDLFLGIPTTDTQIYLVRTNFHVILQHIGKMLDSRKAPWVDYFPYTACLYYVLLASHLVPLTNKWSYYC